MGHRKGRACSFLFFVCCSVQFPAGIILALSWEGHLRAKASRSLEIMQDVIPLSQEAEVFLLKHLCQPLLTSSW